MGEMVSQAQRRRWRWWWAVAGLGGAGGAAASVWLFVTLSRRGAEAGGAASVLAIGGLLAALAQVLLAWWQFRQRGAAPVSPTPWVGRDSSQRPGMVSLTAPTGLLEAQVRGRDVIVGELTGLYRRRRHHPRVRILHGMGGAGKTTIALAVDHHHHRAAGVQVWWVSAATATDLQTGMRQLAARVGATDAEIDRAWAGLDSAPDLVWNRLADYPARWLLIIDNADDTRLLTAADEPVAARRGWIRPVTSRRGAVLVTTRDGDPATWGLTPAGQPGGWCRLHPVGMLSTADGAQVLLDHAGNAAGTRDQAAALSARLGGLPLALGLAGRYLAANQRIPVPGAITTFTAYQAALDTDGITVVLDPVDAAQVGLTEARGRRLIGRTWEMSLDLLDDRGLHQARTVLRLLSLFADAPIPYQILDPTVMAGSSLFPDLSAAGLRGLLSALAGLGLFDLGNPDTAGSMPGAAPAVLRVHPLVQETGGHHLRASGQQATYLALAIALLNTTADTGDDAPDNPPTWPTWRALTPHALHLFDTAAADHPDPQLIAQAAAPAHNAVRYLAAAGLYTAAVTAATTIHHTCHRILGAEHPRTLRVRRTLAWSTGSLGDWSGARDQFGVLLPICRRVLGAEHPDTLDVWRSVAWWTGLAGDPVSARDQHAALLPICERVFGAEHPDTLSTRSRLALWTGETGDAAGARDQCAVLLPIHERVLGAEHPDTLDVRSELAWWTGNAGDPVGARDQHAVLLPIRERIFGAEHPYTLNEGASLAWWTGEAGDPVGARNRLAVLLPIRERVSGAEHPDTLSTRSDLAWWIGQAGDPVGARDQFAVQVAIRERVFGVEHPYTLNERSNLARWIGEAGDPVSARDQYTVLLPIRERVSGAEHPRTLDARRSLARWTGETGDPAGARDQLAVLLPIHERVSGAEHPETLNTRSELARWTGKTKRS